MQGEAKKTLIKDLIMLVIAIVIVVAITPSFPPAFIFAGVRLDGDGQTVLLRL